MYLHAHLELSYRGVAKFLAAAPRFQAIFAERGVFLEKAMLFETGKVNTLIHIWTMDSVATFSSAVAYLRSHPEAEELFAVLAESVISETLNFAVDAPHAP